MLFILIRPRYFIESQEFEVKDSVMYQDNPIVMIPENNGILSSVNNTKHIRVRYLLIKYRIEIGDTKVKYFPTGNFLADHFTKPFQGTAYRKFRAEIQLIPEDTPDTDLGWDQTNNTFIPIPQECV